MLAMLFLRDTWARDSRIRGHGPKIISVCCSTRRESLWESRQPTLAVRRKIVEAAKYFSAPASCFFFGQPECELAYTNFPTSGGYAIASSIAVSILSSKLPLSFMATFSLPTPVHSVVLYRAFPTKSATGAIYTTRVKKKKKNDMDKRSEIRQTETNSRKQGPKEAERTRGGTYRRHKDLQMGMFVT